MDYIWMLMTWIVNGFELFGLGLVLIATMLMIFNPGNERVNKIRNYMLMVDEEDFK
jgi:hypothetical protein